MKIKEVWNSDDFEEMGWHDSYIYSITFPDSSLALKLDIDYIFDCEEDQKKTNSFVFRISPCDLIFEDVLNLEIKLNFQDSVGLDILEIRRSNPRLSVNQKKTIWNFEIVTDKGFLKFESSGYYQILKAPPTLCAESVLGRASFKV